jgi:hypothetical protein
MNNTIVFFWTEVPQANNVFLDISKVQLEKGNKKTDYEFRHVGIEEVLCQRYYQQFDPFHYGAVGFGIAYYGGSNFYFADHVLNIPMRVSPTISFLYAGVQYYSYGAVWTSTTLIGDSISNKSYYVGAASDGDGRGKLIRAGNSGLNPNPIVRLTAEL